MWACIYWGDLLHMHGIVKWNLYLDRQISIIYNLYIYIALPVILERSFGLTLFQFIKRGKNVLEEQFSIADGIEERYSGNIVNNWTLSIINPNHSEKTGQARSHKIHYYNGSSADNTRMVIVLRCLSGWWVTSLWSHWIENCVNICYRPHFLSPIMEEELKGIYADDTAINYLFLKIILVFIWHIYILEIFVRNITGHICSGYMIIFCAFSDTLHTTWQGSLDIPQSVQMCHQQSETNC